MRTTRFNKWDRSIFVDINSRTEWINATIFPENNYPRVDVNGTMAVWCLWRYENFPRWDVILLFSSCFENIPPYMRRHMDNGGLPVPTQTVGTHNRLNAEKYTYVITFDWAMDRKNRKFSGISRGKMISFPPPTFEDLSMHLHRYRQSNWLETQYFFLRKTIPSL